MNNVTAWAALIPPAFTYRVVGLLPAGYESYARVLHPFEGSNPDIDVSWREVAQWSGRTLHPLAQYPAISTPAQAAYSPPPFSGPPEYGLSPRQLTRLMPYLSAATKTPDTCYFAVWDGFGQLQAGPVSVEAPFVTVEQRLDLPGRNYLLYEGPINDLGGLRGALVDTYGNDFTAEGVPNVLWPADRAWMVATDIDLHSTYIGGSATLIDGLLADGELEAFHASPTDKVSIDADILNV